MQYLSRNDIEQIASHIISQYKQAYIPDQHMCYNVDIVKLASLMGYEVEYVHITKDGSILGKTSSGQIWTRIQSNPADRVERPKKNRYVGSYYDNTEVQKLFEIAKGTHLEIPIFLGAFYGLRRSEALGLRWDAIDFTNNTLTINHTVTSCMVDGKKVQVAQDTTKTKSSMRTLPLIPTFKERLLVLRSQQDENMRLCGRCYNRNYLDYVCVDNMGTLLSPNYLSATFPKLLEKNGMRHIRFHDLRHSCASLLLANDVPMKPQISMRIWITSPSLLPPMQ